MVTLEEARIAELEAEVAALQAENLRIRNWYRLQLFELAGSTRGKLTYMQRRLETALDAATHERPSLPVVIERLEDGLRTITEIETLTRELEPKRSAT